jgi:hypothetical protein
MLAVHWNKGAAGGAEVEAGNRVGGWENAVVQFLSEQVATLQNPFFGLAPTGVILIPALM